MGRAVRRLANTTNVIHGFIYFVPEAAEEYERLGLADFSTQYFGSRAAPMGQVSAEVVLATFFNFSAQAVEAGVPRAWETAHPHAIQTARLVAARRVLERVAQSMTASEVAEASEIASAMVGGVSFAGRPLAAANHAIELPEDPPTRLWQLITVIREYRGDAHVAALVTAPVSPVEALVLHAATALVDRLRLQESRRWPDAAWDDAVVSLRRRGFVTADGAFTAAGAAFREAIEERTDQATQSMLDVVGDDQVHRFCDLIEPLRDALIAERVYPWAGLNRG